MGEQVALQMHHPRGRLASREQRHDLCARKPLVTDIHLGERHTAGERNLHQMHTVEQRQAELAPLARGVRQRMQPLHLSVIARGQRLHRRTYQARPSVAIAIVTMPSARLKFTR